MNIAGQAGPIPIREHNAGPSAVWSSGGAAYDEVSRGILDAIEHTINRLEPAPGMRILDVATGTGWTARRLAELGCEVTGVDFAPDMLAHARERASARGFDIAFLDGDAEALLFDDGAFDAVISTFGVMFAQRPEDAAAKLDPEQRARFEADFTAFHDGFADTLGITVPREYRVVHGVRD